MSIFAIGIYLLRVTDILPLVTAYSAPVYLMEYYCQQGLLFKIIHSVEYLMSTYHMLGTDLGSANTATIQQSPDPHAVTFWLGEVGTIKEIDKYIVVRWW